MPVEIDPHPFDMAEETADIFVVGLNRDHPQGLAAKLLTWCPGAQLGLSETPIGYSIVHQRYVQHGPDHILTARQRLVPGNMATPIAIVYCVTGAEGHDDAESSDLFRVYEQAYDYVLAYGRELRRAGGNPHLLRVHVEAFAIEQLGLSAVVRTAQRWLGPLPARTVLHLDGRYRAPTIETPYGSQWALPTQ
jgi:hypothetical protein